MKEYKIEETDVCEVCRHATQDWKYYYKNRGEVKFIKICENCHSLLIETHFRDTYEHEYIYSEKIKRKIKSLRW